MDNKGYSDPWLRGGKYWYTTPVKGKHKSRQISLRTRDQSEAWATLAKLRKGESTATAPTSASTATSSPGVSKPQGDRVVRFHELRELHVTAIALVRKARTADDYKYRLTCAENWVISEMTIGEVEVWLKNSPGGDNTKMGRLTALNAVLDWGVTRKLIPANPIKGIRQELQEVLPGYQPRVTFLEHADRVKVLDYCKKPGGKCRPRPELYKFLSVLLQSGARPHELRITEAKFVKGNVIELPVARSKKSKKGRRILLKNESLKIVQTLCKENPEGPIFRMANGQPWTADLLCNAIDAVAVGTSLTFSAYTFRHSFITDAINHGVPVAKLASICGTSIAMLEKVYYHPTTADLDVMPY